MHFSPMIKPLADMFMPFELIKFVLIAMDIMKGKAALQNWQ